MKRSLIFAGVILMIFCNCKQVVKMRYGVHEPHEETPSKILDFLKKMGQSSGTTYIFKDSSSYCQYLNDPVFRENLVGSFFFNTKGLLLNTKDTNKCRWSAAYFIKNLKSDTAYKSDTTFRYEDLLKHIIPLKGPDTASFAESTFDYFIIITWAMFAGKLNERLFAADEAAKENPLVRIKIIFLNVDMQKNWKLSDHQKMVIR